MKRIAITGPESTGKSTLAKHLAEHFNAIWVSEFARHYIETLNRAYTAEDLEKIAQGQLGLLKAAEARNPEMLFCDTELLVLKIWYENAFSNCPDWILEALQNQNFDLYLLMDVDLPWEPDPQREHPHLREHFFNLYKAELERYNFPFEIISGTDDERYKAALNALKHLPGSEFSGS